MADRTKRALGEALKELLGQKPLEKITIQEITDLCDMNRMTFYYHFHDIYELVEWVLKKETELAVSGKLTYENWQEGLLSVFREIKENKTYIRNLNHTMSRDHLESYLHQLTDSLLLEVLGDLIESEELAEEDEEFIISFYRYAFLGVIMEWIDRNMKDDPEQIVHRLDLITRGVIRQILPRFIGEDQ